MAKVLKKKKERKERGKGSELSPATPIRIRAVGKGGGISWGGGPVRRSRKKTKMEGKDLTVP